MRKQAFAYAKTKAQICFAETAKLISAFVFATRIVQFLCSFKLLACFYDCTGRFESDLVRNPEDRFSSVAAHIRCVNHALPAPYNYFHYMTLLFSSG